MPRTPKDTTPEQVAPLTGEPLTEPNAQLPAEQKPEDKRQGVVQLGNGLPPLDHPSREGELAQVLSTGRPNPLEKANSPPMGEGDPNEIVVHAIGTDKVYQPPAEATQADVEAGIAAKGYDGPQPFRLREGMPDLTTESVNVRMLQDYWPDDPSRYGNQMRAVKGQLIAFDPIEAMALIEAGMAERADDDDLPGVQRHGVPIEPPQDPKDPTGWQKPAPDAQELKQQFKELRDAKAEDTIPQDRTN